MKANIYKMEALTNLHVGSGDANYGIIDNLIQRDPANGLPTIYGSSLKGALKEFFEYHWSPDDARLNQIFGTENNSAGYRFLAANLVAMPLRSNKKQFFLATAPAVLTNLKKEIEEFKIGIDLNLDFLIGLKPKKERPVVFIDPGGLIIEDFEDFQTETIQGVHPPLFGNLTDIVLLNDEDFIEICSDYNLPVIARNKVGEDKNLWYEQIVPHKSLFTFLVLHNEANIADFDKQIQEDLIHVGANATVGYGFTKISKLG